MVLKFGINFLIHSSLVLTGTTNKSLVLLGIDLRLYMSSPVTK
jgi:hypothetical protein